MKPCHVGAGLRPAPTKSCCNRILTPAVSPALSLPRGRIFYLQLA